MDLSPEDKDLLEGLADLYNAVDAISVAKVCKAFRENAIRQCDRLTISADALKLFAQTRGNSMNLDTKEWREFFGLASDIEERAKLRRKGNNARQKRFRQLRILARITVLWGPNVLEHYGFDSWNFEKLDSLAHCAEQLPNFARFAHFANYVLLERHEKSLTSNMSDRIGQHSFRNQHSSVANFPEPHQPLQTKDVNRVLKFLQGKATLTLNGHRCNTKEHLAHHASRIEEWVQDHIGHVDVLGTKVKDYSRYQAKTYQLGYDVHGLLVPRDCEGEVYSQERARKRGREEHSEEAAGETMEAGEDRTPVQKRTKVHADSMYPTPPVSSPQRSILSSPPSSMDSDVDFELDEESSNATSAETYLEECGNERSTGENFSNAEGNGHPMLSHNESHGRPSRMEQDSSAQNISPHSHRLESTNSVQSEPTVLSSAMLLQGLSQSASLDHDAPGTSCFDNEFILEQSTHATESSAPHHTSNLQDKNAFVYPLNTTRHPDTATSDQSFSSMITYPPDTPNGSHAPPARSGCLDEEPLGTRVDPRTIILTGSKEQTGEASHNTRTDTSGTSSVSTTPNPASFANFRAISSTANNASSTAISPMWSPSSGVDELVNLLNRDIESELSKDQSSAMKENSIEALVSGVRDKGETRMDHFSTASSPSRLSRQDCPVCGGSCTLCQVPLDLDRPTRNKLFEFGHRARELESTAPNETLRRWIEPLNFAQYLLNTSEGHGDVCLLSWKSCRSQVERGRGFEKPTIIREDFADSEEWTPSRYANLLDFAFEDTEVDVKWHQQAQPERVFVSKLVELLRTQPSTSTSENPPNVLNLPDITGAIPPSFLRNDRFRLLDLVIERCRADLQKHIGKQIHLSPFDMGSCRRFNILGWPGAFSGPHVDSNGATWVRNLFGHKLWMFVPNSAMTPEDWKRFAEDGDTWDPRGKCRGVILEPGDVFVMEPGLIHAVYTLGDNEPCLMTGGMFWDQNDLLRSLETLFWIGKNQNATNEPIAYQLAQVISTLEDFIERNSRKRFADSGILLEFRRVIKLLRSLGCSCEDCDDECRCSQEDRRCTPLCAAHNTTEIDSFSCMLEMRNRKIDIEGNEDENSDGEYIA